MAIKVIDKKKRRWSSIPDEASLLKAAQGHPHIIPLLGVERLKNKTFLIMELANQGSLRGYIEKGRKDGVVRTEEEVSFLVKSILMALEYMHLRDIVHRDLKPENLLLCEGVLKVADFGLSVQT